MGFFNELGKKTSEFGKKTSETTSKLTKEAKLKMKIGENKGKMKSLYEEIGKKIYENYIREDKVDIEEFIKQDCQDLDSLSKEIENARKEILELNNKKLCGKCFAEIEKDAKFCAKCGEKQAEESTVLEVKEEKLEKADIPEKKKEETKIVKKEPKNKNKK